MTAVRPEKMVTPSRTDDGNRVARRETVRLLRDFHDYRAGSVIELAARVEPPPGTGGWCGWYVRFSPEGQQLALEEGRDAEVVR